MEAYLDISRLFLQNEIGDLFGNLEREREKKKIRIVKHILKRCFDVLDKCHHHPPKKRVI